jgi:shikimate kinase
MAYPKTGSILDSTTRTALSTQILIIVGNTPVGAVQSFSESQSRSVRRVFEIGTDGTVELVPESPAEIGLRIDRIVFDGLSVTEAFSRGFRNIQAQRISFDIVVIDQYTGTGDDAVITTYEGCWFESIDKTYNADSFIITENVSVKVENIRTQRGGEAVALSQGVGGSRQIPVQIDSVETAADSGVYRGALDFPGLISATF